jgi:hypothetical protein
VLIEATVQYGTDMGDLLPAGLRASDVVVAGPAGTTVHYDGMMESRAIDILPVLQFLMDVGKETTAIVIAAWIVQKFRGRVGTVMINRRTVDLDDEGQVRQIVEEEIKLER